MDGLWRVISKIVINKHTIIIVVAIVWMTHHTFMISAIRSVFQWHPELKIGFGCVLAIVNISIGIK